jgi:hypothetical protein
MVAASSLQNFALHIILGGLFQLYQYFLGSTNDFWIIQKACFAKSVSTVLLDEARDRYSYLS